MGESYRGLTIKLGADTTALNSALKSINAALTTTQREIKRVDRALKMDGGNVDLIALKMTEVSERTSDLQSKMLLLDRAERQLDASGISKLAEQARNSSLNVERMKEAFNEANKRLEVFNRNMRGIADAADIDALAYDARGLVNELERLGLVARDTVNEYDRLAAAHHEYQARMDLAKQVQQFRDLKVEMGLVEAEAKQLARDFANLESSAGFGSEMSKRLKAVRTAMGATERSASALAEELELIDKGLKLDPQNTELAEMRLRNLREQASLAEDEVSTLEKAINDLRSSGVDSVGKDMRQLVAEVEKTEEAYVSLRTKIAKAEAALDDMYASQRKMELDDNLGAPYAKLGADIKQAEADLVELRAEAERTRNAFDTARAQKELRELETRAEGAKSAVKSLNAATESTGKTKVNTWAWRSLGVSLSSTLTPALMMAGYSIISTAETFDAAYRDMRKTVTGTEEQFEGLKQAALDYASTHVTSADTILEIEAMGGQLGIATENLEEFATVVSNLDIATNLEADDLAVTMGQLNNVLHWGEGDMERFGNALVRLGNNMPALEDQIVDVTARIGAAGAMYGMSTPEILSWSTAIAATGQGAEAAGTAISNSLSDIENAVSSGGEKLAGFAEVAGMGAEDFARMWEQDASGAFLAFVEGLARIEEAGGSADVALTNLGITGVRQKQALKGLSMTTDVLTQSLQMSENAWNGVTDQWGEANDAANEAEKKSEGFSGAMQILRNNIDETKVLVSDGAVPIIEAASGAVGALNDALENLPDGVDTAIIAIGMLAAGLGPLVTVKSSLDNVIRQMSGLGDAFDELSGKQKAAETVKGMLKGLGGVAAVVGIGAIGTEIYEAIVDMEEFEKATDGLVDAVSGDYSTLSGLATSDNSFFGKFSSGYQSVGDEVDELIEKQAQLAEQISGQNLEFKVKVDQVSTTMDTIQRLMQASELSETEVGELRVALDLFNQLTGSDLYFDEATNQIKSMGDESVFTSEKLTKLANTFALTSALELTTSQYNNVYALYAQDMENLAEAQKAYDETAAELAKYDITDRVLDPGESNAIFAFGDATVALEEAQAAADATEKSLRILYDRMNGYQTALDGGGPLWEWLMGNTAIQAGLAAARQSVIDFHDVLGFDLGFDQEVFSKLTRDQLIALAAGFDGTKESIVESLQGIVAELESTSPEIAALVQAYLDSIGFPKGADTASEAAEAGTDAGEAYVAAEAQAIRDGEQDIVDAVNSYEVPAPGVGSAATGGAVTVDNNAWVPDIEHASKLAVQAATEFGDSFAVAIAGEDSKYAGFTLVEKVADEVVEAAPVVEEAAGEVGEQASQAFVEGSAPQETGAGIADGISIGMRVGSTPAYYGGYNLGQMAQSGASSVSLYTTGQMFASGLAQGIYSNTQAAVDAARYMSQRVMGETKDVFKIASPSRVGVEIGRFWDQGIGDGIEDEAGYAVRRAVDLAKSVVGTSSNYAMDYSKFAGYAGSAASSAHSAAQMASLKYQGPSKADIYDAVSAAIGSSSKGAEPLAVYIDGRQLASSISRPMDSQLGTLASRKGR